MPASDPEARRLNGRKGGLASWANTDDPAARTAPARAALQAKFATEQERRDYYSELGRRSAAVRAERRECAA